MKRREFNLSLASATAVSLLPFSVLRSARAVAGAGGAAQVFNFTNFSSSPSAVVLNNNAGFVGGNLQLLPLISGGHIGCSAIYNTPQSPGAFTTQFTFQSQGFGLTPVNAGFVFVISNVQVPPAQNGSGGTYFGGDANMCGYGGLQSQYSPVDAMCIKFDAGTLSIGQAYPAGGLPSSTGMYLNQGPSPDGNYVTGGGSLGLCPCNDLNPYGINFYNNSTYQVTIVYDGSLLTMVISDTTSGAQGRFAWPLNLANTTNGYQNYIGFSGARSSTVGYFNIQSWSYSTGYNTRLATPTFSPNPGNYSSSQVVTINFPPGSTCYYTTNGLLPTSASTRYTGPIMVSANQVVQAVAIESGYTDSLVATGNYVIGPSSNPINFPTGFSAGSLIPVGYAYLSGSSYRVTDNAHWETSGAVWFPAPVNVASFSTTFRVNIAPGGQGMCFVIQNNPQPYTGLTGVQITGTSGQISFNATTLRVGQYVTITGAFGGTGSIAGYSNKTTYVVGATNGTTTATLCAAGVVSASQTGTTWNTVPQNLTAGSLVVISGYTPDNFNGGTIYYVLSSGLSSTTCQLSATPNGPAIPTGSSQRCILVFASGGSLGGGAILTTTAGTPSGLTFSVNAPNWSGGPTVLGVTDKALGYGGYDATNNSSGGAAPGILNSVAVAITQYPCGGDPGNSVGLYTNGIAPYGSGIATGLVFNTTFNVTLAYDGSTLSLAMQAASGGSTFTYSWPINIPSVVGASTAYVGFTGGSGGGAYQLQEIQSWTYAAVASPVQPSAAIPAAPGNFQVK